MKSLYQQLKEAKSTVVNVEIAIAKCNHDFNTRERNVAFNRKVYSPMDGFMVEGPKVYGFKRYRTCNVCGLSQEAESYNPGVWSR